MKKLMIIAAVSLVSALSALAQGTVTFNNSPDSLVMNSVTGTAHPPGTTVVLALFYGATGTTDDAGMVQLGGTTTIFPSAGRYNGGTRTTPDAPGTSAVFQVRAWDSAFGATWDEFLSNPLAGTAQALHGKSDLFNSATGGVGTPPSAPVALSATVPGFQLVPVPEPSTIALGVIGFAALLFRFRRK